MTWYFSKYAGAKGLILNAGFLTKTKKVLDHHFSFRGHHRCVHRVLRRQQVPRPRRAERRGGRWRCDQPARVRAAVSENIGTLSGTAERIFDPRNAQEVESQEYLTRRADSEAPLASGSAGARADNERRRADGRARPGSRISGGRPL